jgi:FMN phosphatase YigB (HAD superfamily)
MKKLIGQVVITSTMVIVATFAAGVRADQGGGCARPWIFFDLGNTLVATPPDAGYHYIPGAHAYVRGLRARGFHLGVITNIPETWGKTRAEKIAQLKKVIADSWSKDAGVEPMDWTDFPDPLIIVPMHDTERKPAPFTFEAALARVALEEGRNDCPVYYEGEDPAEVKAAETNGMRGYVVLRPGYPPFLPFKSGPHR